MVAVAATGCGTRSVGDNLAVAATAQTQLDALIADGVPGAVAFTANDHDQLTVVSGLANLDTDAPITSADRYRIGSMTKPFTATVVMQLVDEGTLTLDDTVEQRLPGAISNGARITIRELLDHTSGISDYSDDDATVLRPYLDGDFGYVWTPTELVAIANAHGPLTQPGIEYHYSNTNYLVAGLIVEAATGTTLGDEMNTRIIEPRGLDDTSFATTPDTPTSMARGYLLGNGVAGYRTIGYVLDNGRSVVAMANSLTVDDSVTNLKADEQLDKIVTILACP